MDLAYAAADIIISRAGGTISELCAVRKPAILVPSPNVAEDHQTSNAMSLVKKNAAILVTDKDAQSQLVTSKSILEGILQRTDTYEVQYFLAVCEEELGRIEMQRALAAKNPKQQLHAWQSAHAWFAKSVPRFEPILKAASLNVWDRPPTERAQSGLTRSAAEIQRLGG